MKVCTDSCIFGAWVQPLKDDVSILDIGAGTGLLSLMLAQKTEAAIDAVEVDEIALLQAKENIQSSPWNERIQLFCKDIQSFHPPGKYDLIVCNPPFYKNEMHSRLQEEKVAKHSLLLSFEELLESVDRLLSDWGRFAVLLTYSHKNEFKKMAAAYGFYPSEILSISQTENHSYFRYAAIFERKKMEIVSTEEIIIKSAGNYSERASQLLSPYYLHL
jgi:tRNA1Val (adenine37-N6)-methyltransferase